MDSTSTRERLVSASAAVFMEEGIDGASMDSVRQRAGVSNGSLYHYFPTKAKLVDALYADTLRDFHKAVLACLTRSPSSERGVKGMIRAYVRWVLQNPERARLLHELRVDGVGLRAGACSHANVDRRRQRLSRAASSQGARACCMDVGRGDFRFKVIVFSESEEVAL
jgi:AcrR family transcriptional regulator